MEQTKIEVKEFYKYEELYTEFLSLSLILLIGGILVNTTVARSIP